MKQSRSSGYPAQLLYDRKRAILQRCVLKLSTALMSGAEKQILMLVLICADKEVPLNLHHLAEAAGTVISALRSSAVRRLRFSSGISRPRWVRSFYERH